MWLGDGGWKPPLRSGGFQPPFNHYSPLARRKTEFTLRLRALSKNLKSGDISYGRLFAKRYTLLR